MKTWKCLFPSTYIFLLYMHFMYITCIFPSTTKNVNSLHSCRIQTRRRSEWMVMYIHVCFGNTFTCMYTLVAILSSNDLLIWLSVHKSWFSWFEETLMQKGNFIMYNTLIFDCVASSVPFFLYVYSTKSLLTRSLETKINYCSFKSL